LYAPFLNKNALLQQVIQARLKYKPSDPKCLLVAEAPPGHLEHFLYHDDVKGHDHLLLGVTKVLYPGVKRQYLQTKRSAATKHLLLEQLK
jgi:hypothetical protein